VILKIPRTGWRRKQLGFALASTAASESPSEGWKRKLCGSLVFFRTLHLSVFVNPYCECLDFPATYDPELRLVFELATDSELYELEKILFGPR